MIPCLKKNPLRITTYCLLLIGLLVFTLTVEYTTKNTQYIKGNKRRVAFDVPFDHNILIYISANLHIFEYNVGIMFLILNSMLLPLKYYD